MSVSIPLQLLPLLSAALIALTLIIYVILDGADLGVGILFLFFKGPRDRDVMVNSILPVWDANETWLVLSGGSLLALFPSAYSSIMSALYPLIIAMLLSLIFRGTALELRANARPGERVGWDLCILLGSLLAAFCQGVSLGAVVQGIRVSDGAYAGGWWDWLSGFSIASGLVAICAYVAMGVCWLVWRTDGTLQARARSLAPCIGVMALLLVTVVVLWALRMDASYRNHWNASPLSLLRWGLGAIFVAAILWATWSWQRRRDFALLLAVLTCVLIAYVSVVATMFPFLAPPTLDIYATASAPSSQTFVLMGCAFLVPAILAYSTFSFLIFSGKVKPKMPDSDEGDA